VETYFKISTENVLERHLGVDYKFLCDDKNEIYLEATMEKKVNDIVKFFEDVTGEDVTIYDTPGFPDSVLKKNEGDTIKVEAYRTLVGKLMFYTTKVGLKQSNAVRDLSRHMENPGAQHWMAMKRVVGYMKGQSLQGLRMTKPIELRMVSLADADYAKDPVEKKSVGGDIHTLGGCIASFSSRGEKSVSLSSTESEYKMLSNAAKEMTFQQMLLEEIASVKLPGIIFEDNSGAIFLVRNKQVSMRTKHIDVRYHFVWEFCNRNSDGIVQGHVEKVPTDENTADICTKNTDVKTFKYHEKEIDEGFPILKKKVFGAGGIAEKLKQKLFGGMSSIVEEKTLKGMTVK